MDAVILTNRLQGHAKKQYFVAKYYRIDLMLFIIIPASKTTCDVTTISKRPKIHI